MPPVREITRLSELVSQVLQPLQPATRQQLLWELLQNSLSNDTKAISWLLEELGLFLDKESKNLLAPFQ